MGKVYMELQDEISTSPCSSPSKSASKSLTYNHTNGSSSSIPAAETSTAADGESTIRSGLRKLSSLNIPSTRRKGFTKLGSQNDYEQIRGGDHRQPQHQAPSSDTTHAARGMFSNHHRSNTFGAFGHLAHRGEGEVVVRIDDPAFSRADPTSVGEIFVPRSGSAPLRLDKPERLLTVQGQSSPPPKPSLQELDSFDVDDNDDEHFRVPSAVSSPTASSGGTRVGGSPFELPSSPTSGASRAGGNNNPFDLPPSPKGELTVTHRDDDGGRRQSDGNDRTQGAVNIPTGTTWTAVGNGPKQSPVISPTATAVAGATGSRLPPRSHPRVEFTDSTRKGDSGDSGRSGGCFGIQSEGSYDFGNDPLIPEPSGSGSASRAGCGAPGGAGSSIPSGRRKGKSFDFGTIPEDDPPSRLIGAFLRRQTESGSNFLDLDMDMEELTPISNQQGGSANGSANGSPVGSPVNNGRNENQPALERNSFTKDSSYVDLVSLDNVAGVVPPSFNAVPPPSTSAEDVRRWKEQSLNRHPHAVTFPQDVTSDVRINVVEEKHQKSREAAARAEAAANRSPSSESGVSIGLESPSSAGIRMRKNGSFQPSPSPPRSSTGEEVVKSPTKILVRPCISRLKSRLADLPKPVEVVTPYASGVVDEGKVKSTMLKNSRELKSGLTGAKLKKVEEEEEDPLKDTDLPEKYRKREKGLWTIFQFSALLLILAGLACILSFSTLRKMNRGGLALWKWVVLVMVVICGRLISGWIVWIVVFIIEKNFLLRKRVVYFVYALRKGVQNCLWLGFALLAWHFMIDPKVDSNRKVVNYVTKVLICFLVAAIIVLVKTFLVKVFASSFHVNNYFERIQEALLNQYIMETLAGLPLVEFVEDLEADEKRLVEEIAGLRDAGATGPSFSKLPTLPRIATRPAGLPPRPSVTAKSAMMGTPSGMVGSQQQSGMIGRTPRADEAKKKQGSKAELNLGISIEHLQKLDMSNISAWNMKRLMHIIRNSTLTHSLEETVNSEDGAEMEIQSEWQAKCKAKQIFKNVAQPGQKVIMADDLLRFMDEDLAKKALTQFEGATESKRITKQALKKWAIDVYKERRALAYSLNDTKTAVNKLHRIIDVVVFVIIVVIWLLVLGIATTKLLLFMSSQILLLILVWGNTLKTVFEAIVFLFVMHPFDVGDRCVVDGMQLVVEEMNILTTVFLGDFNAKVWYPNSVLATKPIQNFYRSPEMGDGIEFIVQANTPVEKIAAFKERIGKYILSKPNHWHQEYGLNVLQMTEGERMKLSLGLKHTVNYQDFGEIVKRRSELLLEIKFVLIELGIEYHLPAQEVLLRQPPQELQNRQ